MPMIDVDAANDLFAAGSERQLGEEPTLASLCAEGAKSRIHLNNPGSYPAATTHKASSQTTFS